MFVALNTLTGKMHMVSPAMFLRDEPDCMIYDLFYAAPVRAHGHYTLIHVMPAQAHALSMLVLSLKTLGHFRSLPPGGVAEMTRRILALHL